MSDNSQQLRRPAICVPLFYEAPWERLLLCNSGPAAGHCWHTPSSVNHPSFLPDWSDRISGVFLPILPP